VKHRTASRTDVSRETEARLSAYADLLRAWNRRINLISRADESNLWVRHIEDSLQLASLIPRDCDRAIDLGSGAGFPGLVLSIATGIHFHLVESDQRKAAFLREAARVTGAPVAVHATRAEDADIPTSKPRDRARPSAAPPITCNRTSFHRPPAALLCFRRASAPNKN
jgi:16S rRNA (guanine527-N7)-methyltransferase